MMTGETKRVPWESLLRRPNTRTSEPTQDAVRAAMLRIGHERGRAPKVDTVIFAALRVVQRLERDTPGALRREVEAIEASEFDVPVLPPPPAGVAIEPGS